MPQSRTAKEKLGRVPNLSQLCAMTEGKLDNNKIARRFGGYEQALAACGLTRQDRARRKSMMEHFINWATTARKLKKVPTMTEFSMETGMWSNPLRRKYKSWSLVPASMLSFMEREKLEGEWGDVAKVIREHAQGCSSDLPLGSRGLLSRKIFSQVFFKGAKATALLKRKLISKLPSGS